jgi:hypothetical protein
MFTIINEEKHRKAWEFSQQGGHKRINGKITLKS